MELSIADLLYSFYLTNDFSSLKRLYESTPKEFIYEINNHFSTEYYNDVYEKLNLKLEIDN